MGGNVPKAHGVGITSGLKMKKGGRVEPTVAAGSGNQPMKMGPDGQMREAAKIGTILGIGEDVFSALGRFFTGRGGLMDFIRTGRVDPMDSAKIFRDGSYRYSKKIPEKGIPGEKGFKPSKKIEKSFDNLKDYREYLRVNDPDKFAREFGTFGRGLTRSGRALRGLGSATGVLAPAGLASTLVAPPFTQKPDTPVLNLADTVFRETPELAYDAASFIPGVTLGLLSGQGFTNVLGSDSISSALYGDQKDKVGSALVDETKTAKTQREQKDEFAGLSDKAERMAAAITRENNLATLSKAASDFGASALAGEDLATAVRTGSQPIFGEVDRRKELQENIGGLLAQSVLADEATQGAMIAEAAKTGDPQAVNRMQKYFDAYNEGVTNILPLDAKGKIDYANMAPGTVYMDLEGVSGARYVASNSGGDDTQSFDSVEDANAFAQS